MICEHGMDQEGVRAGAYRWPAYFRTKIGSAIESACDEVIAGKLHDQFIVDPIQGGAGTSTNMNANEVIANRAIELLGGVKGNYTLVHPNDHVNCGQSTNDVYPTCVKMTLYQVCGRAAEGNGSADRRFGRAGRRL